MCSMFAPLSKSAKLYVVSQLNCYVRCEDFVGGGAGGRLELDMGTVDLATS